LYDCHFINSKEGWAVGDSSSVLRTTDGGASWERIWDSGGQPYNSASFTDSRNGWVVNYSWAVKLLHTYDGGVNWTPQLNTAGYGHKVFFIDKDTGWTFSKNVIWGGSCTATCNGNYTKYPDYFWTDISRTFDGGKTWTGLQSLTASSLSSAALFFLDSQNGFISFDNKIMATADGGRVWINQPGEFTGAIYAVMFHDKNTGWAVGDHGLIYKAQAQ
jgi:photosystem II stability/assembly factor-like uncharacterized protein